ncbi:hypothetical protein GGI22_005549, partial [Coemansia erecta]
DMNELLDSTEMLPFAVPTSREWMVWWQSRSTKNARALGGKAGGEPRSHNRDWSNETVAYHHHFGKATQPSAVQKTENDAVFRLDANAGELAPAVPSKFLNALMQGV